MDTNSEQFPADQGSQIPIRRAEDCVFDAIQGSDHSGFENHEGQPDPEAPGMDFVLSLPGVGEFLLEIKGVR